ncbi:type II toxin-antitoxin system RelE/ParE family toxin [Acidisoma silvae]|uniref:Type II toxin-antitoxin system RelE/ParE family toxin n=1 Tax=Acidisoma silvae TaxID=2802396 RepID=A0A963YNP6_9PROT|nr:type II toxin-antitoxin system RelE/ParE family toxin [Acidisoma silvae]
MDDIWIHVLTESGSPQVADDALDALARSFLALARFPGIGRVRDQAFGQGRRSLVSGDYLIIYMVQGSDAWVMRVIHGRRDIAAILSGDAT